MEDLCNHLQLVMDKKDNLAARLHEAYDDHMVIDADYHRYGWYLFSFASDNGLLVISSFDILMSPYRLIDKTIDRELSGL